ncbi:hypothetical protein BO70DRAFT_356025 [Aspergillus heteromorphus CBS 117.55]|uniref:Uncharacterized protein n=1 Tax=Aspergillus heteromorphus CBS 117.55 TaxID=1448321 RepID=A0A317V798_9EURO|nr:uncharacterized protein BO70DRAFT_356025 [Aspergillus heteromorphus CBS 117.55]PWY69141.1 hypothetical protein BO70DRAFT_356025 [Aspergillus heteromorphus CBS 117.55]
MHDWPTTHSPRLGVGLPCLPACLSVCLCLLGWVANLLWWRGSSHGCKSYSRLVYTTPYAVPRQKLVSCRMYTVELYSVHYYLKQYHVNNQLFNRYMEYRKPDLPKK